HLRLGKIEAVLADFRAAEAALDKGVALLDELCRRRPDVPEYQRDLAAGYATLGNVYRDTSRFGQAEAAYKQARETQEKLVEVFPSVAEYRLALARTHFEWGFLNGLPAGRHGEAVASYEQAQTMQARLVEEYPQVAEYRAALGQTQMQLGTRYRLQGMPQPAEAALGEALR